VVVVPEPHAVQTALPVPGAKKPKAQLVQAVAATTETYWPSGQAVHEGEPTVPLNWPFSQLLHRAEPESDLRALAEYVEVPTEQLEHAVAPALEYVPETHAVHELLPVVATAVPAGQDTHTLAPGAEYMASRQERQAVTSIEAVVVKYFPAGQFEQLIEPVVSAYLPAGQLSQTEKPA